MATQPSNPDRLRRAMRGGDPEIERAEAFALLAVSLLPEKEELLAGVLQDRTESPAIRSAAAIALGRIFSPESEQILVANLGADEPAVQIEVLLSLGRIGGPRALATIDSWRLPMQDRRHEAAAFAEALIAHRLRLDGYDLAPIPEAHLLPIPRRRSQQVRAYPVPAEESEKVIADLARQPYGIEYDREKLVRLACGERINVWCPNREFTAPRGVVRLLDRKALAGVVALRSSETGDHSVSYLLMTAPRRPSASVIIFAPRCTGRTALAGAGEIVGNRLEFSIRAVDRPGAFAMDLSGDFTSGELLFSRAAISVEQVPSRRPSFRQ